MTLGKGIRGRLQSYIFSVLCSAVLGKFLRLFDKVVICTFGFGLRKLQLLREGVNFELQYIY